MGQSSPAIFIHSLFRAGSTYLFDVFRGSPSRYWCYQEPENEILLELANCDDPVADTEYFNSILRHPPLEKPYLAEYMPIRDRVVDLFDSGFAFDRFFLGGTDSDPTLVRYIDTLISTAQGRPVLQFCRSTGRIGWMRTHFAAQHLFLWRHPWDQWWSYKVTTYFDTANLLILNATKPPPVFADLRLILGVEHFSGSSLRETFGYFENHGLDDAGSYTLFYAIWYHAMHEGLQHADIAISIDQLSGSEEYRASLSRQLELIGISGLDFSGCKVPQGMYTKIDESFFQPIEANIHQLFARHGYSEEYAARIRDMRSMLPLTQPDPTQDLVRLRSMFRRNLADISRARRMHYSQLITQHKEIERLKHLEEELKSIYNSRLWKSIQPFLRGYWRLRAMYRKLKGHGTQS